MYFIAVSALTTDAEVAKIIYQTPDVDLSIQALDFHIPYILVCYVCYVCKDSQTTTYM